MTTREKLNIAFGGAEIAIKKNISDAIVDLHTTLCETWRTLSPVVGLKDSSEDESVVFCSAIDELIDMLDGAQRLAEDIDGAASYIAAQLLSE